MTNIVSIINEISDKINLLSLNAAIEARAPVMPEGDLPLSRMKSQSSLTRQLQASKTQAASFRRTRMKSPVERETYPRP